MKVVIDTNVLFAAFASPAGFCAAVVQVCILQHSVILSTYIRSELLRQLAARKKLGPDELAMVAEALSRAANWVQPALVDSDVCRDPDDLPVLGTAVAGNADVLISGDKDLLAIGKLRGTEVLSPRQFAERFAPDLL